MGKRPCSESEPHVITSTRAVATLSKDINIFATNSQVPKDLGMHVFSSEEAQRAWYEELSKAWNERKTTPTPLEATRLVLDALERVHPYGLDVTDLEGFLYFYGLPHYRSLPKLTPRVEASPVTKDALECSLGTLELTPFPVVVEDPPVFLLNTHPVNKNTVIDGCHFTVTVEAKKLDVLPSKMLFLISERRRALANGNKRRALELLEELNTEDYELMEINNVEVLTKRFKIRLRGINSPEIGPEATDELAKMVDGKCLTIAVYDIDDDMHCVGDVYCDNILLQEILLMEGSAWRQKHD